MSTQHSNHDTTRLQGVSRRQFITRAAGVGAAVTIVPRHVLGRGFQAPSDLVNVAVVGVAGMGASNTRAVMSQNVVAFCDVDMALLDARIARWGQEGAPGGAGGGARQGNRPAGRAGRRGRTGAPPRRSRRPTRGSRPRTPRPTSRSSTPRHRASASTPTTA